MIRVLVADDSLTARILLVELLSADPELEVVGEAADGVEALAAAHRLHPDVVTMDIQMPRMDGFEATKRIMAEVPTPIVIASTLDVKSIGISMNALRAGALVVLPKPRGVDDPQFDTERRRLVATVKAMARVKLSPAQARAPAPAAVPRPAPFTRGKHRAVGIVSSAGGPSALLKVLADLPPAFPAPVFVVQHIAPGFADGLARWLNDGSSLTVKLAEDGEPVRAGVVYLAPDDRHLGVEGEVVRLSDAAPIESFRPAGTHLFRTLAAAYGSGAVVVVLSGMGRDGLEGAREVKRAGGAVLAQSEASSQIFGMPGAIIEARLEDAALAPSELGGELVRLVGG